jgi:hypothetical protein
MGFYGVVSCPASLQSVSFKCQGNMALGGSYVGAPLFGKSSTIMFKLPNNVHLLTGIRYTNGFLKGRGAWFQLYANEIRQ